MRVAVIGAGAIGGWLTAGCIEGGAEATVLARGASLDALRNDGLWLDDGTAPKPYPVTATDAPRDLRGADILLLGLKAHDLPGAAPLIEAALAPDTIIVPAINGLPWWYFDSFGGPARGLRLDAIDPGGVLSRLMPADQIVGSVVHAASLVSAPGRIRLVKANKVWLGAASSSENAQHAAALVADLMSRGGIPAETTDKLHWHVWNKLWGNSNTNPISALTRADIIQLLEDDHVRDLLIAMMREMAELGMLIGLEGLGAPEDRLAATRKLGPFRTSMLQDVEAGRALELDPILGGLVELADHLDRPIPAMQAIYGMTRLLDRNLRA